MPLRADVKNVFHNAGSGTFDADVTIHEGHTRFCYAVEISAPITAEFDTLRPAMIRAAEEKHAHRAYEMRAQQEAEAQPNRTADMLDRILFTQPSYLDEILSRAA